MARRALDFDASQLSLPFLDVPVDPPADAHLLRDADPHRIPESPAPRPIEFQHPRASHEVLFGEHLVCYELKRARRRSIGFVVGPEGLSVSAPRWMRS